MSELPEITDEDRAVGKEAYRLWNVEAETDDPSPGEIAAALVRTGWKPVDPDLLLARECAADLARPSPQLANAYRDGIMDDSPHGFIPAILAAIKAADARRKGDG